MNLRFQADTLASFGASPGETEELLSYNTNLFDLGALAGTELPLPDEPFVAVWEDWERQARERGAFAVLREHLPQLRFPIREGISGTEAYRAATLRGVPPEEIPEATGLALPRPELVEIVLHKSPAGRIPLVIVRGREEFVALLRAIARKNEPAPVPDAQGALMISGYNNWTRIHALGAEFRRLQAQKELYQDRFILLSNGPYSAVPAADLGLSEEEWREMSLVLRREHECTHYLTRRLFGSMRNNVLDEILADYAGITAAAGRFREDWLLRFLYARLDLYRGDPPLSDGAFRVLRSLLEAAAGNIERWDGPGDRTARVLTLASLRLEDLAANRLPAHAGANEPGRGEPA
ncbi:MAG TPA: hypothetical protein VLQ45_28330 [Thermoanaerobaculia bacterium]|nr:hypothetical protein [Thermoanaerobaculia bacterium]